MKKDDLKFQQNTFERNKQTIFSIISSKDSENMQKDGRNFILRKHDLMNLVINRMGYKSYLEIGICKGRNFGWIEVQEKDGVDPDPLVPVTHKMTSDEFFTKNKRKYDMIFIDGDHRGIQVRKDIDNAKRDLNHTGIIFIHDIAPPNEAAQVRDDQASDGWKALATQRMIEKDWWIGTLPLYDVPMAAMYRGVNNCIPYVEWENMNWDYFEKNRRDILNITSLRDFEDKLNQHE